MTIKELREKNKLTQTALAKSLGVSSNAISAIESGRLKLSKKLTAKINEVYGEAVEQTAAAKAAEEKVEAAVEKLAENAAEAVLETERKAEKKTGKARTRAKADKPAAEAVAEAVAAPVVAAVAAVGKKTRKTRKAPAAARTPRKKAEKNTAAVRKTPALVIQSPFGGEITPDAIFAKIGDADTVYVRIDQNKAYWVKGEETGSVDLW